MKYVFVFLLVGLTSLVHAQTAEQPNCDEIEGFQTADKDLIPEDYTGIAFKCKDGKVKGIHHWKDGKEDGLMRYWWGNGQLNLEWNYKDGKLDGLRRSWYANGQIKDEMNYKDGQVGGLVRSWFEDGQLSYERNYKDGKQISEKCWDKDGNRIKCYDKYGNEIKFD